MDCAYKTVIWTTENDDFDSKSSKVTLTSPEISGLLEDHGGGGETVTKTNLYNHRSARYWFTRGQRTCIALTVILLCFTTAGVVGCIARNKMISPPETSNVGSQGARLLDANQSQGNQVIQDVVTSEICGTTSGHLTYQGENDVTPGRWPWVGSLRNHAGGYDHHCGVVLIDHGWALTAAHCLQNPRLYEVTVESIVFGDIQLDENSVSHTKVDIEKIYIHPMYNRLSSWNDVAVLKLATSINFTDDVRPICLESGHNEVDYATCYTAGWRMQMNMDNDYHTTFLKETVVELVELEVCRQAWRDFHPFQTPLENELCFVAVDGGETYVSVNQGDRGGPLMCLEQRTNRWHIVGILSDTTKINADGTPGLATRISTYWDFITSLINNGEFSYQCETLQGPCADLLPYSITSSGLQNGLESILDSLFNTSASDCHPDYKTFVCAAVYYACDVNNSDILLPCEDFCIDVLMSSCSKTETLVDRLYMMHTCRLFPSSSDVNQRFCPAGIDSECFPDRHIQLSRQTPFLLNSRGFPTHKVSSLDCVWIVTTAASVEATIVIKLRVLEFHKNMEALTVGVGDDSQNKSSIVMRSWESASDMIPSPLFTGFHEIWIRYVTHWPYDKTLAGFSLELWATNATESDLAHSCDGLQPMSVSSSQKSTTHCDISTCFPTWWRCDHVSDCPDAVDEQMCAEEAVEVEEIAGGADGLL